MKIGLFLMGEKGLRILETLAGSDSTYLGLVKWVVGADDKNVTDDHYEDIRSLCRKNEIPHYHRKDFDCSDKPADYAIAAGWRWLIRDLDAELIVLHDSLLPRYRGFNPLVTALIEGDTEIGVTAIEARSEFDSGDIYRQKRLNIEYPVTIGKAISDIAELYGEIVLGLFEDIRNTALFAYPQDQSEISFSLWRDEEDYRIDWTEDATRIVRMVDAVGEPYLGAATCYDGRLIRILNTETLPDLNIVNRTPGKLLRIRNNKPEVVCGTGLIRITEAVDDATREHVVFNKLRVRLK